MTLGLVRLSLTDMRLPIRRHTSLKDVEGIHISTELQFPSRSKDNKTAYLLPSMFPLFRRIGNRNDVRVMALHLPVVLLKWIKFIRQFLWTQVNADLR